MLATPIYLLILIRGQLDLIKLRIYEKQVVAVFCRKSDMVFDIPDSIARIRIDGSNQNFLLESRAGKIYVSLDTFKEENELRDILDHWITLVTGKPFDRETASESSFVISREKELKKEKKSAILFTIVLIVLTIIIGLLYQNAGKMEESIEMYVATAICVVLVVGAFGIRKIMLFFGKQKDDQLV